MGCPSPYIRTHKEYPLEEGTLGKLLICFCVLKIRYRGGTYVIRSVPLAKLSLEEKSAIFCLNNEVQDAEKINTIHTSRCFSCYGIYSVKMTEDCLSLFIFH
jgi:hypothetical protein